MVKVGRTGQVGNLAEVGRDLRTSLVSLIDLRPSPLLLGGPKNPKANFVLANCEQKSRDC